MRVTGQTFAGGDEGKSGYVAGSTGGWCRHRKTEPGPPAQPFSPDVAIPSVNCFCAMK